MVNRTRVIGYEIWRVLGTRKYGYIFFGLCYFAFSNLRSHVSNGVGGTAPFSVLSYMGFLTSLNTFLLPLLVFLCIPVFDSKEREVRQILFSSPISSADYYFVKVASIVALFSVTVGALVLGSVLFYAWHFGFLDVGRFIIPILMFLVAPAILLLGLCMVIGRWSVKALYFLALVVWLAGVAMLEFPPWLDLSGDDYLAWFETLRLRRSLENAAPPNYLQSVLVWSRVGFVLIGTGLLAWSSRSHKN